MAQLRVHDFMLSLEMIHTYTMKTVLEAQDGKLLPFQKMTLTAMVSGESPEYFISLKQSDVFKRGIS